MPTSKTLCFFDALAARPPANGYAQLDLRNDTVVLDFDDTVDESVDLLGILPRGYAGGDMEVVVSWTATFATTGSVVWQAEFERHPIGDTTHGTHDLDVNDFGTASTATVAAPANSGEVARTAVSLSTSATDSAEAGETFRLRLTRLATNGFDTMAGDAELVAVEVREV